VQAGWVSAVFDAAGRKQPVISMSEKRAHFFEVQDTASRNAERRGEIERRAAAILGDTADIPVAAPETSRVMEQALGGLGGALTPGERGRLGGCTMGG
jgi:hypothetical protein